MRRAQRTGLLGGYKRGSLGGTEKVPEGGSQGFRKAARGGHLGLLTR
jgi:hypothetical protein